MVGEQASAFYKTKQLKSSGGFKRWWASSDSSCLAVTVQRRSAGRVRSFHPWPRCSGHQQGTVFSVPDTDTINQKLVVPGRESEEAQWQQRCPQPEKILGAHSMKAWPLRAGLYLAKREWQVRAKASSPSPHNLIVTSENCQERGHHFNRAFQKCQRLQARAFSSVRSLSRVRLFATPWTAARQASLPITNSRSPPKLMSTESVMPSNHLIACRPLLLPPSIFPSIRVFSNESALLMRWTQDWSFHFNISPSNEHPALISFRMDWLDLLAIQGTDSQESSPKCISYLIEYTAP